MFHVQLRLRVGCFVHDAHSAHVQGCAASACGLSSAERLHRQCTNTLLRKLPTNLLLDKGCCCFSYCCNTATIGAKNEKTVLL